MCRSKVGTNLNRAVTVDWFLVSCIVTAELAQSGQKGKRSFISHTFVLYASVNWSLTFREEPRLRVFENIWAYEGRGNKGVEKTT